MRKPDPVKLRGWLVGDVDLRRESGLIAQNERATQPFGQAAHNLLDNAAKYSPADAPIRLKTASEGSEARIAVEEAGPGIPEDEQKEIFEAFYRGAATKQSGVKGTGIGLSASRQIVDAHGGRITLASTPGAGSQFEIVLPLDRGGAGRRDDGEHPGS